MSNEDYPEVDKLKKEILEKFKEYDDNASPEVKEAVKTLRDEFVKHHHIEDLDKTKVLETSVRHASFYERLKNSFQQDVSIDPGRLMGLTDGIFGMVITLLAFGIALPEFQIASYSGFIGFVYSLIPSIGTVIVSFILLSSFWIYHHEFIKLRNIDLPYLWVNIFFLLCISFVPFTTSVISTYSEFFLANVLFGINIFLTNLSFLVMFSYAYNHDFLENRISPNEKRYIYNTFIIIMILTVIVNLGDFLVSKYCIYLLLFVPIISTLRDARFKRIL